jgi:uncharacterized protein YgbK (DUF1537 family)
VPVAETEFAEDPVFAYRDSDLRAWAARRMGIARDEVASIALDELRRGGEAHVAARLADLRDGRVVVLDAVTQADLELAALGIAAAERDGRRFVCRTGPSFVAARAGRALPAPLDGIATEPGHGLVVVGSHTALTTRQLERAVDRHGLATVELAVDAVTDPARRGAELERAVAQASAALGDRDMALATSRTLAQAATPTASVELKAAIASAVVEVVERVVAATPPAFVVAKGGITANDLATKALGAGRATVLGQLFPGQVSVWRLHDVRCAPLPYVVFPGNVGDDEALADAVARLKGSS